MTNINNFAHFVSSDKSTRPPKHTDTQAGAFQGLSLENALDWWL
jgi:hypothetical protein